jgi:hypothetical protein
MSPNQKLKIQIHHSLDHLANLAFNYRPHNGRTLDGIRRIARATEKSSQNISMFTLTERFS